MRADPSFVGPAAVDRHLYAAFVDALPKILNVASYRFRRISCPDTREDCVCETVALCWVWYTRLARKGRSPETYLISLANYGARAVSCGRRACGQEKASDVLSRRCQQRHEFTVSAIHDAEETAGSAITDAVRDNTITPVLDQVQFRIDFRAWTRRLPDVKKRLVDRMALGHRSKDLAAEFRVTEGRISQLRKEFHADYSTFCEGAAGC